jgi:uncharacterized membrane protein YjgN (DUF898 family)
MMNRREKPRDRRIHMKSNFQLSLSGKDWWGPFLGFWVLFLLIYVPEMTMSRWGVSSVTSPGLYFGLSVVFMFLVMIVQSIFVIVFLRIILPKLSIGGRSFGFRGDVGRYLGINLLGLFLSIITVFIYIPWFIRRVAAYLASETTFDGTSAEFLGKGGRLFVIYLLALLLPAIIVGIIVTLALVPVTGDYMYDPGSFSSATFVTTLVTALVMLIVMAPFLYFLYKWFVNVQWKDVTIAWKTSFWPSLGFLLGQLLLTLVTAGIYWPAACLRIYRYFAGKTALSRGEAEIGRLGFEGGIGKGFGLIWGQTLLCIITLGIYIPWGYAKIGRWLAGSSFCQTSETEAIPA